MNMMVNVNLNASSSLNKNTNISERTSFKMNSSEHKEINVSIIPNIKE